jgi:hypothetical protein
MNIGILPRLAVTAGLAVAGTGAVVAGTAVPAQAAVITATSAAAAGTVTQTATAFCPAGQFLSGGGGAIVGGGGDVTLVDIIPDLAAQSVTVRGRANPGAAPPAYVVLAQSICVPGAVPANYQLVSSVSANNGNPIKTEVVACPAGTNLLGLGAELQGGFGAVFYERMEPNVAVDAAEVTASASGGFAGPWQLTAYGICATPPAGVAVGIVTATGPNNNNSPKATPTGACPAGTLTTGVGGRLSPNATGNVFLAGSPPTRRRTRPWPARSPTASSSRRGT